MIDKIRDREIAEKTADRQSSVMVFAIRSVGDEVLLRSKVTRRVRGLKSRCA